MTEIILRSLKKRMHGKNFKQHLVFLGVILTAAGTLRAQDTRTVTEPVIPPSCIMLDAQLTRAGSSLSEGDEGKLDTARIQQAIDKCGKGQAVVLQAHGAANAFLSGPLELREGVTLVVGKGATLFASRDAELFATSPGSCGILSETRGCRPLISVSHVSGAGLMGDGVIDGRGGEKILGKSVTWWDLATQAKTSGHQQCFRLIVADTADNFTLYRITLKNSPNFHVVYSRGDGFTVWGVKIDTPQRGAGNTDGIDPGSGSKNITITHSFIRTGDDNVAIKGGGPGELKNMTVSHNHFYWGHGMSIGSETNGGVSAIRVFDLSLDGPDNGIRIKSNGSRGGLVHDVMYDDVCVRDSRNPITLDTGYTAAGTPTGDSPPTMRDVTLHNVRMSGGGKISFNGYDKEHRVGVTLDNVLIDGAAYKYSINHADFRLGPGPVNLQLAGDDSTVAGKPGKGSAESCAEKFVPLPKE